MGVLRKTEWTEDKIQDILRRYFFAPNSKKYEISNLYIYGWESDYIAVMHSGIMHEVEIKVTKADFKNDFKNKQDKHLLLEGKGKLGKFSGKQGMPNYFYYAVPEGVVTPEEVPEYAGLIYVYPWGVTVVKDAKKLTDEKFDADKFKVLDKFYYNMVHWKAKYKKLSNFAEEIKKLKQTIKDYEKNIMFLDERLSEEVQKNEDLVRELKKISGSKESS